MACSSESLPCHLAGSGILMTILGQGIFLCVLSCVVFGGGSDIMLTFFYKSNNYVNHYIVQFIFNFIFIQYNKIFAIVIDLGIA